MGRKENVDVVSPCLQAPCLADAFVKRMAPPGERLPFRYVNLSYLRNPYNIRVALTQISWKMDLLPILRSVSVQMFAVSAFFQKGFDWRVHRQLATAVGISFGFSFH